jgi:hypothetical protein
MNAVIKENRVETIFDYVLRQDEHEFIALGMSADDYMTNVSEHDIYFDLAALFDMRGDKQHSSFYKSKLNPEFVKTTLNWDRVEAV